jgi:hypothetical protein
VTFLAAYTMHKTILCQIKAKFSTVLGVAILGVIFSVLFIAFPLVLINIEYFLPQITDKFTHALLESKVNWTGFEVVVGFLFFAGTVMFYYYSQKKQFLKSYLSIYFAAALSIFLFLPLIAPKIEIYTQRAPVEFFKSLQTKDVYVHTLGYKSYAPFFYQQKEMNNSRYYLKLSGQEFEDFLLTGEIQKPAYFSAKINNYEDYLIKQPELKELYRKNGFIFFERKIDK